MQNKLLMHPNTRNKLLQMNISDHMQKGFSSNVRIIVIMILVGITFFAVGTVIDMIFGEGVNDWAFVVFFVLSVLSVILIFPVLRLRKGARVEQLAKVEKFTKRHGSYEKAETEIKNLLNDENSPAYHISAEEFEFYIIGNWYLDTDARNLHHITEIVAIVGIMGEGTFLILDDGKKIETRFGPEVWGTAFDLFKKSNPYVLYTTDKVTLSNGSVTDVVTAYKANDFSAITKTFLQRKELQEKLDPFFWVEHEKHDSVCLYAGEFKNEIFQLRSNEGFEGGGYDWASLAEVFLSEKMPELENEIEFDPEAGMFCAYSSNAEALKKFALGFRSMCNDDIMMKDLFSKAEF